MKTLLFVGGVIVAGSLAAAVPTVSDVTFTQNPGQRTVRISYTLANAPAIITVDIRTNGVSIGEKNFSNVRGPANRKIDENGTYTILWSPEVSWAQTVLAPSTEMDAVVTAWAPDTPPDYMVVELDGTKTVRYYTSADALPGGLLSNKVYRIGSLVMRRMHAKDIPWTMRSGCYPHTVTLTNDYYIGVFEFTQGQYAAAIGSYPSSFFTYAADRDMRPVENRAYGELRGYTLNYWPAAPGNILGTLRTKTGLDFDFPSNAQWEFAARAGNSEGCWGDGSPYLGTDADANLNRLGRHAANAGVSSPTAETPASEGGTAIVGSYEPNAFGLYDMHGNVWEWVLDGWSSGSALQKHGGEVNIDPSAPSKNLDGGDATQRAFRGGSFNTTIANVQLANADSNAHQSGKDKNRGFRVVCPLP